jgi:hypothetical protein
VRRIPCCEPEARGLVLALCLRCFMCSLFAFGVARAALCVVAGVLNGVMNGACLCRR